MRINEVFGSTFKHHYRRPNKDGNISLRGRSLTSLQGSPTNVDGDFDVGWNKLKSLRGGPQSVQHSFRCDQNKLTTLDYCPNYVGGHFIANHNKITSLHNIHKKISYIGGTLNIQANPIAENMLGLCLIDGIWGVLVDWDKVNYIFNDVFRKTTDKVERMLEVQDRLIEIGAERLARL